MSVQEEPDKFAKYEPGLLLLSSDEHREYVTSWLENKTSNPLKALFSLELLVLRHPNEVGVVDFFRTVILTLCKKPNAWAGIPSTRFDLSSGRIISEACATGCLLEENSKEEKAIRDFSAEICLEHADTRRQQARDSDSPHKLYMDIHATRMALYAYFVLTKKEEKEKAIELWTDCIHELKRYPNVLLEVVQEAMKKTNPNDPLWKAASLLMREAKDKRSFRKTRALTNHT